MMQISCADVNAHMPAPLAQRMEALMTEMYGDYFPKTCTWVATGETREQVIETATEHVRAEHAVRSWPPEFWVHMRECIHEA